MDTNEVMTLAGVFFGGILIALAGYFRKTPQPAGKDGMVTAVGIELGNKLQMDELIKEVRRIGDILADKKQAGIEAKLDELLEKVEDIEDGQGRRG